MFNKTLHKINGGIDAVYMTTAGILFIVLIAASFVQVFTRYIMNSSLVGTEELARYCFIWMSLLGGSIAVGKWAHTSMAFSTDCGTLGNHIGTNALEFENLVAIGMSNAEALRAATSVAARVTGREDRIGRILPGYQADITVLGSSPLEDIKATSDVRMTLVNGRIMYNRAWAK